MEDQELAYEGREYWMDDLGLLRAEATDAGNADDEIAVGVAAENKQKLKYVNKKTREIEVHTTYDIIKK